MKISIKDLTADYGTQTIIRNLFLDIPCGNFIAVVGHNGAGKSTFFKTLTNKIPYLGSILFPEQHSIIAMLGQKNDVNFSIPVIDLVVMGLFSQKKIFASYNSSQKEIALSVLKKNGISHLANKDFLTLSGGEQQLVWLSQLMLQKADIYLFDEPTQYLDIAHTKQMFDIMQNMVIEKGKTVICITHHLHYLKNLNGYILNLSDKKPELIEISENSIKNTIEKLS